METRWETTGELVQLVKAGSARTNMTLAPFRIEHYFARHEFTAQFLLSSSDAESRSLSELLEFEPDAREQMEALWLGYTEVPGEGDCGDL
jgi:hypothetical protein